MKQNKFKDKIIPEDWVNVRIGEIYHTTSGGTPSRKNKYFYEGNIPWVKSGELNAKYIIKTEEYITEEAIKQSSAKIFPKGTLLIALYGATIGKLSILNISASTNQAICGIFNNGTEIDFLYYYLFHKREELIQAGIGGAQPNISQSTIRNLFFPLPPLLEQRAIVARIEELFSRLDKGVETLQKVKEQLKVYRQAVLKWAFEGKLTAEWRKSKAAKSCGSTTTAEELLQQIKAERERHYQQKLAEWQKAVEEWEANGKKGKKPARPKKTKELSPLTEEELAELPELPEGWSWLKIKEIGEIETGTTPSKKKQEYYGGEIPLFKPTDLEAGYNVRKAHDYISEKGLLKARYLPKNSILVTCIGATIGKTGIIRVSGTSNQQINAIIPQKFFNPNFVYFQVISPYFQKQIKDNASATTLPILNKSRFENLIFACCSKNEQQAIVQEIETRLSVADKLEQIIDETLQKAEALRQSILKKAFEGKLLSEAEREALKSDPEWEPAEKLLERIKAEKEKQETKKNNKKKRK